MEQYSYDELENAFCAHCKAHHDEDYNGQCRYGDDFCLGLGGAEYCKPKFIYDVLTGKHTIDEPFTEPTVRPDWLADGKWIINKKTNEIGHVWTSPDLEQPDDVFNVGWRTLAKPMDIEPLAYTMGELGDLSNYAPIKFRPYTFDEALQIMGKTIVYAEYPDECRQAMIIHSIYEDTKGFAVINNYNFSELQRFGATIDLIPIGVPTIDEDAIN